MSTVKMNLVEFTLFKCIANAAHKMFQHLQIGDEIEVTAEADFLTQNGY